MRVRRPPLGGRSEASVTTSAGFVPIRLDVPRLLGPVEGRREGHLLSALLVGVELASAVDWRTDVCERFSATGFADSQGLTWRRLHRAVELLAVRGIGTADTVPFRPGRFHLTPRSEPGSMLHDRGRPAERFVALARGALGAVGDEHQLSWVARALLVLLLLVCDHRTDLLPDGWTKTRLCDTFGVGWRRLTHGLGELEAAGLIAHHPQRGGQLTLRLLARAALVVPTMAAAPKRRQRRHLARTTHQGAAAETAAALLAHHHVTGPPPAPLVRAIGQALATGTSAPQVLDSLCARGSLAGARDPIAVLNARAAQLAAELADARRAADTRRKAQAATQAAAAADRRQQQAQQARSEGEGRWLASILPALPAGADLGLPDLLAGRPAAVAAHIHAGCTSVVAAHPDLDPAGLVRRWAIRPVAPEALDVSGIGRRTAEGGPPGDLPVARDGPTLVDRLRGIST